MSDSVSSHASLEIVPTAHCIERITLDQFLESEPLHSRKTVSSVFAPDIHRTLQWPQNIRVHCDHAHCDGVRRHARSKDDTFYTDGMRYCFARYVCTNCTTDFKIFALKIEYDEAGGTSAYCTKVYQDPAFGSPVPRRLFKVIGEDNRQHFLQARRAIARGLGIGAYAYYRRIVENTKFELISSIIEIAKATKASTEQISLLETAQQERQFSKAISLLQDVSAIPPILLINGHNPLALIHDLLSEGIHQLSDAECLDRAKEAEVILCEIAQRMQLALTERKSVNAAISSILRRKGAPPEEGTAL